MPLSAFRRSATRLTVTCLLALPGGSSLSASTLTLSTDPTRELNIYVKGVVGGVATEQFTTAGVFLITLDATYQRVALCVDYFTGIDAGVNYRSNLAALNSISNGLRIAWLIENALPSATTQLAGAALQLAIWDIVHDNADGFDLGSIRQATSTGNTWSPALLNAAINYETISAGKTSTNAWIYLNIDPATGLPVQDLISPIYGTGPALPEGGSLTLVASGAAFLARYRRAISARLAS